jgi:hypothetical protein
MADGNQGPEVVGDYCVAQSNQGYRIYRHPWVDDSGRHLRRPAFAHVAAFYRGSPYWALQRSASGGIVKDRRNPPQQYSETVRDLHALIRREASDSKRDALSEDVDRMAEQLEKQRDALTELKVLSERVDGLVWLVRGVVVACLMEVIAGVIVALLVHGRG